MEFLPKSEDINVIQKLRDKIGTWETLKTVGIANYVSIILVVLLFLYSNKNFKTINESIGNITNVKTTINVGEDNRTGVGETPPLGTSIEFKEDDWIIENYKKDNEGYYCPTAKNFTYWSIWSKRKVPLILSELKIKLLIKKSKGTDSPPTLVIVYGEYKKDYSPQVYYRLNIFDDSLRSIRLYDSKNKSVEQDWLSEDPDLSSEIMISISPRSLGPDNRKIGVNPKIAYSTSTSPIITEFKSEKDFIVMIPIIKVEDKNINKQIGIGVNSGTCFKITSVEF